MSQLRQLRPRGTPVTSGAPDATQQVQQVEAGRAGTAESGTTHHVQLEEARQYDLRRIAVAASLAAQQAQQQDAREDETGQDDAATPTAAQHVQQYEARQGDAAEPVELLAELPAEWPTRQHIQVNNSTQPNGFSTPVVHLTPELEIDADFSMETSVLWAGEGLDFVPVPTIRPQLPNLPGSQSTGKLLTIDPRTVAIYHRWLIRHYVQNINGYPDITETDTAWNQQFLNPFANSLIFLPFFYAMLALSVSHVSIIDSAFNQSVQQYETLAEQTFTRFSESHKTEVEGLLSALFLRIKKTHAMGGSVVEFLRLMSMATDIITSPTGQQVLNGPAGLSHRIIIRLAILDARAACYRLGGGALVRCLKNIPSMSFIFHRDDKEFSSLGIFIHLFRASLLRMKVGELDTRLYGLSSTLPFEIRREQVQVIKDDIQTSIDRWQHRLDVYDKERTDKSVLNGDVYGCYCILSTLHSAFVYLHNIYPEISIDVDLSVRVIMGYQYAVHRDASRSRSPSSVIPSSLLLAGAFAKQRLQRKWAVEILKRHDEWWFLVRKVRQLLEAVHATHDAEDYIDFTSVMDQTTGRFVI
ncbi:hypothetical protein NM208_g4619 [Fusarium decemcellulare]|uniref:Uncharacterized protein n=2 Tax=Fusarium decemcellulare TaxID=57161 RepID=A0ACC1RVY1_9HYPO|nr:hypothetical protein NM208_g10975 [Fusarium decemcellulare]KAJ3541430.1 hypothetical protein NM208_g4619 [Fusarium decemcellulare]